MPGAERVATAMKSLTMNCVRCYKNPAIHFGGKKFAPSVDHIELEYNQLKAFLRCPSLLHGGDPLLSWGQAGGRSKSLAP